MEQESQGLLVKFRSNCRESVTNQVCQLSVKCNMEAFLLKNPGFFSYTLDLGFKFWLVLLFYIIILLEVKKQSLPLATFTRELLLSSPNTALCVAAEDRVSLEA